MTVIALNFGHGHSGHTVVSLRCPGCRQQGTFEPTVPNDLIVAATGEILGIRRCPNPSCRTIVFVVVLQGHLIASYPPERVDFDSSGIPKSIVGAFEEVIACHAAQCYVAAAIMVRKTLELICHDRGASGANLKERLQSLRSKVILPPELFDGLDDLRLLGNDAAHVESQIYTQIGREEVEVGIEFTKEILKATFQYNKLLQRLKNLKKPQP